MTVDNKKAIREAIDRLLRGPQDPDKEFVAGGATFGKVYAMAAAICDDFAHTPSGRTTVCLATEDKAVLASALLAALAGGPALLLPYAFSATVIDQLQQATGFTIAIAESSMAFSRKTKRYSPQTKIEKAFSPSLSSSPETELLKIYTGGSTGKPQLWAKTAINIFSEGFFLAKEHKVTADDCIIATVPPYHIYGLLFSIILPLVSGATVVGEVGSFPNEIERLANKYRSTLLVSVPAHYRVLQDRKIPARLAFSSAGMLDLADNEAFCRHNGIGIVEVYGSTETGGIATRNRSLGEEFFTPFSAMAWKIVDNRLLVDSPFISPDLPVDQEGYYTANDRVEPRGVGQFSLEGRSDSVSKVGGKRVDLEEIRQLLKKEPGVADAVVVALPEAGGRENLIAALIEGKEVEPAALKRKLAGILEAYAVPRIIKKVERIPITQNGKYDRLAIVGLFAK